MWIRPKFFTIAVLINYFSQVAPNANECGSPKLDGCFCGKVYQDQKTVFVVNCTDTRFLNTEPLKELPEQTQHLIFKGNRISVLENNLFGDRDLSTLTLIDMTNNGIREIKGQAFHRVANVEMLILDHNDIVVSNQEKAKLHHPRVFSNFFNLQELHLTNAFADNTGDALANDLHDIFVSSNLTKVYKLHLEQNEIKHFKDEKVFCDLKSLHDLHLGDNLIPSLNFNITCIEHLRYLDLEANNITKFSQNELDTFDKLSKPYRSENLILELKDNPFRCDSAVKNLYTWLHKTNVDVRQKEHLECQQIKYGKRYIINLKTLADSKHAKFSQALTILLVVLVFILATLLAAYFYLKKDKVKSKLSPLFDSVARKVHYTSIESQDV